MTHRYALPEDFLPLERKNLQDSIEQGDGPIGSLVLSEDGRELVFANEDPMNLAIAEKLFSDARLHALADPPETLFVHRPAASASRPMVDPFFELVRSRQLHAHGEGTFSVRGPFLSLMREIDAYVLAYAHSRAAEELDTPVMLTLSTLARIGTPERQPRQARYLECRANREPEACRHALCIHALEAYEGGRVDTSRPSVVTIMGRSFREEAVCQSLERLREFSMREVVALGTAAQIAEERAAGFEFLKELARHYDLPAEIVTASDSFMPKHRKALQTFQLNRRSKLELLVPQPFSKRAVAVASLNDHDTHFTKAFSITGPNRKVLQSFCLGVGLERLAYLIVCHHGPRT